MGNGGHEAETVNSICEHCGKPYPVRMSIEDTSKTCFACARSGHSLVWAEPCKKEKCPAAQ